MNNLKDIEIFAQGVIRAEAEAIAALESLVNESFASAVQAVLACSGRLVVTGVGKSAIIARKIVATMNSTGTSAVFMHAADAVHGDLGIICPNDIVMCLSKSGSTPEIEILLPLIKGRGNKIIALVCNADSGLAQQADYILNANVTHEACPNNLAPTSSTTAQLVVGDAFAMTLLRMRGFTAEDFARSHPGGALGKRMYTKVDELLSTSVPKVDQYASIPEVIQEISTKTLGATVVVDKSGQICGIITDGDLRRMLQSGCDVDTLRAEDVMTKKPQIIDSQDLAYRAFMIMEQKKITQLVVVENNNYKGIIHIHDILCEGIM